MEEEHLSRRVMEMEVEGTKGSQDQSKVEWIKLRNDLSEKELTGRYRTD